MACQPYDPHDDDHHDYHDDARAPNHNHHDYDLVHENRPTVHRDHDHVDDCPFQVMIGMDCEMDEIVDAGRTSAVFHPPYGTDDEG